VGKWFYTRLNPVLLLAFALAALAYGQDARMRLGQIAFYGYEGVDLAAIRAALPVREGEEVSRDTWSAAKTRVEQTVQQVTGHPATDIATICCDNRGALLLYVGVPGRSYHPFNYHPAPAGSVRLPAEALELNKRYDAAIMDAVTKGQAAEDDSLGYALLLYPPARAAQLAIRAYALHHERLLREVLALSSESEHRAAAATFLGYTRQSKQQIAALVAASRDVDDGTRNAAIRALGVLAGSSPKVARQIPAAGFVEMLNSGIWTDRNKASMLLMALSADRDPKLLTQLRSEALSSLIEMARWDPGHAGMSLIILGRMAGVPEQRLQTLVAGGNVEVILAAVQGNR
jgi:hypothetical protein